MWLREGERVFLIRHSFPLLFIKMHCLPLMPDHLGKTEAVYHNCECIAGMSQVPPQRQESNVVSPRVFLWLNHSLRCRGRRWDRESRFLAESVIHDSKRRVRMRDKPYCFSVGMLFPDTCQPNGRQDSLASPAQLLLFSGTVYRAGRETGWHHCLLSLPSYIRTLFRKSPNSNWLE